MEMKSQFDSQTVTLAGKVSTGEVGGSGIAVGGMISSMGGIGVAVGGVVGVNVGAIVFLTDGVWVAGGSAVPPTHPAINKIIKINPEAIITRLLMFITIPSYKYDWRVLSGSAPIAFPKPPILANRCVISYTNTHSIFAWSWHA
jgi:hypothetical protein